MDVDCAGDEVKKLGSDLILGDSASNSPDVLSDSALIDQPAKRVEGIAAAIDNAPHPFTVNGFLDFGLRHLDPPLHRTFSNKNGLFGCLCGLTRQ